MRILAILMLCLATFVMGYALRGAPASELPVVRAELERTRAELALARRELQQRRIEGSLPEVAAVPVPARTEVSAPPQPVSELPRIVEARADLERMATYGASARDWREFLARLVADGSPEALDVILATMRDVRVSIAPQLLADLLREVPDVRIGALARTKLERVLAGSREDGPQLRGYLDLLAHHLDAEGAQRMLAWLGENDALGTNVARFSGNLVEPLGVERVLASASEVVRASPEFYASLAATRDPAALLALETMLYSNEGESAPRAALAGSALGGQLDAAGLEEWSTRFWSSDAHGRAAVLQVLAGLDGNHTLSPEEKRTHALPVVHAILLDPSDPLLMPALRRAEYDGDFHVPELIGVLEGLREALPLESPERAYAMRVLAKLQKALAGSGE